MLIGKLLISLLFILKSIYLEEADSIFMMLAIITAYSFVIPCYYKHLEYPAVILLLSFFISKGSLAGFFIIIWILSLLHSAIKSSDKLDYVIHFMMVAGSVWLLAARCNFGLLGFYTPWTELTAIHLTVAGALTVCVFKKSAAFLLKKTCNLFIIAQLIGVSLTATGILCSASLETIGTFIIATNLSCWALNILLSRQAILLFKMSALSIFTGVILAVIYNLFRPELLSIAVMSATHGMLNLFGFIVPISFARSTKLNALC